MTRADREQDLIAYYTGEIHARVGRDLPEPRVARRTAYLDQLRAEGRDTVLELGCGPGRDGAAIAAAGFSYTGVDLSPASVEACRELGLHAEAASVLERHQSVPRLVGRIVYAEVLRGAPQRAAPLPVDADEPDTVGLEPPQ